MCHLSVLRRTLSHEAREAYVHVMRLIPSLCLCAFVLYLHPYICCVQCVPLTTRPHKTLRCIEQRAAAVRGDLVTDP